jgi:protoporphyrinogen oxidase
VGERCIIIGGGPAGLTAAYELVRAGHSPIVFEQDGIVGGISRTDVYKGYRFDIGGHRFFTKVKRVQDWWTEILGDEFLERPRKSRIHYAGKFFAYPLQPMNALLGLGPIEAVRIGVSYLLAQLIPSQEEQNLEQWVANRFGRRLYEIFFKTYTEKVWGMPCTEIGADWAAQRIKNLDLVAAVKSMLVGNAGHTTLIEKFHYPRLGPGQMWERVAALLEEAGHPARMGTRVDKVHHDGRRVLAVTTIDRDGNVRREEGAHFISSMAIKTLLEGFDPAPPQDVLQAAERLRYRDFLTVGLIVDAPELFPDNWIYVHSPEVKVGRIQNFKNWSPDMVPDPTKSSIGLEYFVRAGDELWSAKDEDLIALATRECERLGLVPANKVIDGVVIRMPKAYPVYDRDYRANLDTIRAYLAPITNLQLVGRNGQHRYNNQDHSMLTAMLAVENISGAKHAIWDVNVEQEYHEVKDRLVPERVELDPIAVLQAAFARYDPIALGGALAMVCGLGLFYSTIVLVIKGGDVVGPHLSLLGHYLFGYRVTWAGAFVGMFEAAAVGFVLGFAMALAINAVVALHQRMLINRLEAMRALEE